VEGDSPAGRKVRGRGALTPEVITSTAIVIADAEGLEAVSIRRIAAELDARPMSLYDHFDSKDDLLGAMSEEVTGEFLIETPLPEHWREALTAIARRNYAVLVSHRWYITVRGLQPRFGPNATKAAKLSADAVATLPLEREEIWLLLGTVNDYVLGHSLRALEIGKPEDLEDLISESDLAEYPELSGLPESFRSRASVERFEAGLQIVLDGVERRVAEAE
jgi:AcrR family transcriptional regulator